MIGRDRKHEPDLTGYRGAVTIPIGVFAPGSIFGGAIIPNLIRTVGQCEILCCSGSAPSGDKKIHGASFTHGVRSALRHLTVKPKVAHVDGEPEKPE
jgi:hypothetical protein